MLISPSEPLRLRKLGTVSSEPERFGMDFLLPVSPNGFFGVQRKTVPDYVASLRDGRLSKEILQAQALRSKCLVLEGDLKWSSSGTLLGQYASSISQAHHLGFVFKLQSRGWWVHGSTGLDQTASLLSYMTTWLQKEKHSELARPAPEKNPWGTRRNRDWCCWVLQSFEGIGPELAGTIYDHFKRLPLSWTVTVEELSSVPGLGPKRVAQLWEALNG